MAQNTRQAGAELLGACMSATVRTVTIALLLAAWPPALAQDAQGRPATTTPKGPYAIARLQLTAGLDGKPQRLLIALRNGRLANLWFVAPIGGDRRLHVERSSLALTDGALKGVVDLRTATGRGRPMIAAAFALDLTVADDKVRGTYELAMGQSSYWSGEGRAEGRLDRSARPGDALAAGASWPSFWGPKGDMSANPQPPLIDDLSLAHPVWRSEAYVPTGYGNAPDSRYFTRALISGNGGGGSSPVGADNTVFIQFYLPNERVEARIKGNPYWERTFKSDAEFRQHMVAMNATEREASRVLGHFRAVADDHVVAIDARTGATKWHTVLPRRSPNIQTHKHRGTSGVPLVAGDTIFVPNLASRLYAIDTKTGRCRWEFPAFEGTTKPQDINAGPHNPSPLLVGGNVIWARGGKIHALDAATGQEQWTAPGGYLTPWTSGGSQRLVAFAGKSLLCVDARTGKVLWQQETDLAAFAPLSAVIAGDILIASLPMDKASRTFHYRGLRLSDSGAKEIWRAEPITPDENMPVTVVDGRVYFLRRHAIRVLDAATGKQLAEKEFAEGGPGSNAWIGVVGKRFLYLPEGQHGTARLGWLDREGNLVGSLWLPTNTDTTAYNSQPIIYPVVDGRLFVRGGDGIYCYDLRSAAASQGQVSRAQQFENQ